MRFNRPTNFLRGPTLARVSDFDVAARRHIRHIRHIENIGNVSDTSDVAPSAAHSEGLMDVIQDVLSPLVLFTVSSSD